MLQLWSVVFIMTSWLGTWHDDKRDALQFFSCTRSILRLIVVYLNIRLVKLKLGSFAGPVIQENGRLTWWHGKWHDDKRDALQFFSCTRSILRLIAVYLNIRLVKLKLGSFAGPVIQENGRLTSWLGKWQDDKRDALQFFSCTRSIL